MKSSSIIGERILLARKKKGLSLRTLESAVDGLVSAQAIGKYERGEMTPGSTVLIALGKALGVSLNYLVAPQQARLQAIEFRKRSKTTAKDRSRVEAEVLEAVERYLQVEEILCLPSDRWECPFTPQPVSDLEDADGVAKRVRETWALGIAPIQDMTELLEEKGIKVLLLQLPDDVSGLTCIVHRENSADVPVIVINYSFPVERRRYTLAHELGHRLMTCPEAVSEKAANRFAGAFLIPAPHLQGEIGRSRRSISYQEIMTLKKLYRVSASSLWVRLRQLNVIDETTYLYAYRTFARTWRSHEPEPLETGVEEKLEQTRRFERLCLRTLSEKLISLAKASELLQLPIGEIERKLKGPDFGS